MTEPSRAERALALLTDGRQLHRVTIARILGFRSDQMESLLATMTNNGLVYESDNGMIGLIDPVAGDGGRESIRYPRTIKPRPWTAQRL